MAGKRLYLNFDGPAQRTLVGYDLSELLVAAWDYARLWFRGRHPRFSRTPHWPPR